VHNGELAKQYQVSLASTRKECPSKLGITYRWSKCFVLGWKYCCIVGLVQLR